MTCDLAKWKGLVVTCPTQAFATAVNAELNHRVKLGLLPADIVKICISDPEEGYGSGGATINGLLAITEYLSAKAGYTVLSSDVLVEAHIIILHMGRSFPYDACGRGFVTLPLQRNEEEQSLLLTNFDLLFHIITKQLGVNSPPGVWVCSSDMIVQLSKEFVLNWTEYEQNSACCITMETDFEYASQHGVFKTNSTNEVEDILYRYSEEELENEGITKPLLVTGIVFFPTHIAEQILNLHVYSPIDSSTYLGLDTGCKPIQISLFFDILLCMVKEISKEEYLHRSKLLQVDQNSYTIKKTVSNVLWETLHSLNVKAVKLNQASHHYLSLNSSPHGFNLLLQKPRSFPDYSTTTRCHCHIQESTNIPKSCVVVNSIIGKDVVINDTCCISHCHLKGNLVIGENCVLSGINADDSMALSDCKIPNDTFIMGVDVQLPAINQHKVFICLNINQLMQQSQMGKGEFIKQNSKNISDNLYKQANIFHNKKSFELEDRFKFLKEKLFPVTDLNGTITLKQLLNTLDGEENHHLKNSWKLSFLDIIAHAGIEMEFNNRRNLFNRISCEKIKTILSTNQRRSLQPLLFSLVCGGSQNEALKAIEEVLEECLENTIMLTAARAFFTIADILNMMAGKNAGLRSGPAANKAWMKAFSYLNDGLVKTGAIELRKVCQNWMQDPLSLIRAARHYEGAGQILIRKCCMTVSDQINVSESSILDWDTWIVCETAARLDLSGGWSDTPPICYENGGAVVNVALKINGKRPISAKMRRIPESVICFVEVDENEQILQEMKCSKLCDFNDYNQPTTPGALLKACFVLTGVVDLKSNLSLKDQLLTRYKGGFEIHTWANLPRGSGMGTSSILAGAILQAIYKAVGKNIDRHSLLHSVLLVEQMLTTGGGWQDQVGGIIGGVKICRSKGSLPLAVNTEPINCPEGFLRKLEKHFLLVYTGKTRLARNLLQEVLRNWYACEEKILTNCKDLVANAEACKQAFRSGDMSSIGQCLTKYWYQKKVMAPGCEPSLCSEIMKILQPYVLGQTLAGAGGGGFLFAIAKKPMKPSEVEDLLSKMKTSSQIVVYETSIDYEGMQIYEEKDTIN